LKARSRIVLWKCLQFLCRSQTFWFFGE